MDLDQSGRIHKWRGRHYGGKAEKMEKDVGDWTRRGMQGLWQ